jgi:hypothetical protein
LKDLQKNYPFLIKGQKAIGSKTINQRDIMFMELTYSKSFPSNMNII